MHGPSKLKKKKLCTIIIQQKVTDSKDSETENEDSPGSSSLLHTMLALLVVEDELLSYLKSQKSDSNIEKDFKLNFL